MAIETNLTLIFWDTVGGILKQLPTFILLVWGFKLISKEIGKGIKQMPSWINLFFVEMQKAKTLDRALGRKYG